MKNVRFPKSHLKKIIKKHVSLMGFSRDKEHRSEYLYIKQNPKLHYLWKDLRPMRCGGNPYSIEELKKIIAKYDYLRDLAKEHPHIYQTARKRYPQLLKSLKNQYQAIKYTDEQLFSMAQECETRQEFQVKYPGAYMGCLRRGRLNEFCAHMGDYSTTSSLKEESVRFILEELTGYKFPKFDKFEGRLCLDGYSKELKLAFEVHGEQHYKFVPYFHRTKEGLKKQQENDLKTKKACAKKEINLIVIPYSVHYRDLQSVIENELNQLKIKYKNKKVDLRTLSMSPKIKWDFASCKKEAKKYKTRHEFSKNSAGAYTIAGKNGWLQEICKHMNVFSKPRNYWTKELFFEHVKKEKYKSIREIRKKCGGGIDAAYVNNWLKELYTLLGQEEKYNKFKRRKNYSKKEILKAMKKCKTLSQFRHSFKGQYKDSLILGMQKEIIKNLIVMNPESLYK